ncbi:ABC transporter substrate-binding protein [Bartonella tamiae]|uniref:SsuA/THI5-like domain-containing protein n=1 Tax=Bartonella tamiae Th239 TaxID=1094558 RepID=J1JXH6_9HYPH|nr:ABC transporter substrate-binding protein [Bartonella tamiae]EJF89325.1 hypothetical protein ME5_01876 [Bartonella tamiae Th239]EJF95513.1 hypothetical protein MEG_00003 [Bartonella tamiae Th307]
MFKKGFIILFATIFGTNVSWSDEKLSVILDWYLNPDHASLIVAQQIGSFKKHGLDVEMISPSDPNIGSRLVAAKQADIAISYQQQLYMFVEEDLPLIRIGTLIETPLNTVMALPQSGIRSPADLKGKKIGFSNGGVEEALLETIFENQNLTLNDVELINVNFNLVSALLSQQVDAVIGGFRNVEGNEMRQQGIEPIIMKVEDYGVPPYDELVFIIHKDNINEEKYKKFLLALSEGAAYLKAHPQQTWVEFARKHSELNNDLNESIWLETAPLFSDHPIILNKNKYISYGTFLYEAGVIKADYPIESYATQLN